MPRAQPINVEQKRKQMDENMGKANETPDTKPEHALQTTGSIRYAMRDTIAGGPREHEPSAHKSSRLRQTV